MSRDLDAIRQRLTEEGERTVAFFEGLPAPAWDQGVYTTGPAWQARQVLAHLVSAEQAFARFAGDVLNGGPGVARDFDIDSFNAAEVAALAARPPAELLEAFRAARARTLALTASLAEADLQRPGYHPWFGDTELGQMLQLVFRHAMIHQRDVRRAVEHGGPLPHRPIAPPSAQPE